METTSLYYFSEATKDLNFTQTAKRLFTSQQNLSNHIARLEDYYGTLLFERKPKLKLTYAGEVILSYAKNLQMDENNLINILEDIKKKEIGCLHIGCSPNRTSSIMPRLIKLFSDKYPNVEIDLYHQHTDVQTQMILSGELDFSISVDKFEHPDLVSMFLFHDTVFLMISEDLLLSHYGDKTEEIIRNSRDGVHIQDFAGLPFINIRSSKLIEDLFTSAGCKPVFKITSNYPQFLYPSDTEDIAASIITKVTYYHIKNRIPPNVHVFPIITNTEFSIHDIAFTRHKRKYLSQYGQYFSAVAAEYFKNLK